MSSSSFRFLLLLVLLGLSHLTSFTYPFRTTISTNIRFLRQLAFTPRAAPDDDSSFADLFSAGSSSSSSSSTRKSPTTANSKPSTSQATTTASSTIARAATGLDARSTAQSLRREAEVEQFDVDFQQLQRERDLLFEIDDVLLEVLEGRQVVDASLFKTFPRLMSADTFFRIAELGNSASTSGEKERLTGIFNGLMDAIKAHDKNRFADVNADIEKVLKASRQTTKTFNNGKDSITESMPENAYAEQIKAWNEQLRQGNSTEELYVSVPSIKAKQKEGDKEKGEEKGGEKGTDDDNKDAGDKE